MRRLILLTKISFAFLLILSSELSFGQSAATNITFSNPANTALTVNWTNGGGNYRIVTIRPASSGIAYPSSGYVVDYSGATTVYGSGPNLGSSNYVVYAGTGGGPITITGLGVGTQYTVVVFECTRTFLGSPFNNYTYSYNTSSFPSASRYTLANPPTYQASNITFSAVATGTMTISWTYGGSGFELVAIRASGSAQSDPVDGTGYTASTVFGSGSNLGNNNYVIYSSSSNNVTVTGLTAGTLYYVTIYSYNRAFVGGQYEPTTSNYITPALSGSKYTLANEPTGQASNLTFNGKTNASLSFYWSYGTYNGGFSTGELVTMSVYGQPVVPPTDGNSGYTASSIFGSGTDLGSANYVVYNSTSNSVNVTGLSPKTRYQVNIFTWNGSANTYNYLTSVALSGNDYTLDNEPTVATSNLAFSGVTATSYTVSWTNGNGWNRLVTVRKASDPFVYPVDGNSYSANTNYGSGTNIGSNNYVVYMGSGASFKLLSLAAATDYYVNVFEVNGTSGTGATYNYLTSTYLSGHQPTINNPPVISAINNVTVCQAGGLQTIYLSGIATGGETQTIIVSASSGNVSLISIPTVSYTSPNTTASIGFTPSSSSSGYASITVTVNDGGPSNNLISKTFTVTISPLPVSAGSITGNTTVCQGQSGYPYSIPAVTYATGYTWIKPSGSNIGSGVNTNSITLNFNTTAVSGNLQVRGDNACGSGTYSNVLYLNVIQAPTTANAGPNQTICTGTGTLAANVPTVGTGVWSKAGGSPGLLVDVNDPHTNVTGLSTGQTASLIWTITNANLCVSTSTVTIAYPAGGCPLNADFYASNINPCTGSAKITFYDNSSYVGGTTFNWSFGAGASPSTFSTFTTSCLPIVVTYSTSGSKDVTLQIINGSTSTNTKNSYINVLSVPSAAGSISGTTPVCQSQTGVDYSVGTISGATGYNWTLPTGANISSGTNTNDVNIDFGASATSGTITVSGINVCGTGTSSKYGVVVNPLPTAAGSISGPATACQGQTSVAFTVTSINNATSYIWTFVPANITAITGSPSVSISIPDDAINGSVTVYGTNVCGEGAISASFSVTVNPLPDDAGVVSGTSVVCQGQTAVSFSITPVNNATSYSWIKPSGASISSGTGTNSITLDFNVSAVSGNVRARGINACGNGKYSPIFAVTVNPLPDAATGVTGSIAVCQGQTGVTYFVSAINNADGYNWTLPAGATLASGNNTNSISADFSNSSSSGSVTVVGTNACGSGVVSTNYSVTVNPLPNAAGSITGTAAVCQGQTAVVYSIPTVSNTANYNWNLPLGATISSGSNTNAITVDYASNASSGSMSVYSSNTCGNGTATTNTITINPLPGAAGSIVGTSTVTACEGIKGINYSTSAVTDASGYSWTLPSGAAIFSGSNTNAIVAKYSAGSASGVITVNGTNSCGNGASSSYTVTYVPLPSPEICFVTADSLSTYNKIIWQKPSDSSIDSFRIYRETTAGYQIIKEVYHTVFSSIVDSTADPNTTYYRYKVSSIDSCGNESSLSAYHRTMFLQASLGVGGVINLQWATYEGTTVSYYKIMRDTNGTGNFQKIDSVPGTNNLYTDNNAAAFTNSRYAIEVVWQSSCAPSYKTQAASINTTRSNIKDKASISSGIKDNSAFGQAVNIYPNPSTGNINIEYPSGFNSYCIAIYDIQGRIVYSENMNPEKLNNGRYLKQLSLGNNVSKGFYTIKIETEKLKVYKKLIIE